MAQRKYVKQAADLIKWYREGSDLTDEQEHVLHDAASERGQILDNVVHMSWFLKLVAENLAASDCF